jgi:hypothetical protein
MSAHVELDAYTDVVCACLLLIIVLVISEYFVCVDM